MPSRSTCSRANCCAPSPSARTAASDAAPMTMPSIESDVRRGCARRLSRADVATCVSGIRTPDEARVIGVPTTTGLDCREVDRRGRLDPHLGVPASIDCDVVLFDMDGTLVDSTPVVERIWGRWAVKHGIDLPRLLQISHG